MQTSRINAGQPAQTAGRVRNEVTPQGVWKLQCRWRRHVLRTGSKRGHATRRMETAAHRAHAPPHEPVRNEVTPQGVWKPDDQSAIKGDSEGSKRGHATRRMETRWPIPGQIGNAFVRNEVTPQGVWKLVQWSVTRTAHARVRNEVTPQGVWKQQVVVQLVQFRLPFETRSRHKAYGNGSWMSHSSPGG